MKHSKKVKSYSCDLETTTKADDCRVWAYGWMEIGNIDNYHIGTDFDEFMEWILHSNATIYFHNLKFDGSFVLNYLLSHGFKWVKEKPQVNEFTTIISNMGQWYAIETCVQVGKKKSKVKIYDSYKKLPFTVKKIAKDFGLPILKGDIDYEKERPIGYNITDDEYVYIKHDIEIIARALHIQLTQNLTRITNGSDALHEYETTIGKLYEKLFPVLNLELNGELRKAYRGGFTWVNPKWQGKDIGEGIVFDVNSLYPSTMYYEDMPCGFPFYYDGEYQETKSYPLYIQKLTFEFELKEGYIPTIQIKNSRYGFKDNEYLTSSKGERVTLYVSSVDWELIKEHYHVYDVDYHHGYMFRKTGQAFKQYIDKWMYIKNTSEGAVKVLAKLMLNSLYGKFATNPDVTGKVPYLKDDGSLGFKKGGEEYRDPVYTPVGVFITSYARRVTIKTAQQCYNRILYCDTDSIHLIGLDTPEDIKVSHDKLGEWKKEGEFKRSRFLRQKTYIEEYYAKYVTDEQGNKKLNDNGLPIKKMCDKVESNTTIIEVKCAGMPDRIKEKVTFDNFHVGFSSDGKLIPKQVKGGVVLQNDIFTIK